MSKQTRKGGIDKGYFLYPRESVTECPAYPMKPLDCSKREFSHLRKTSSRIIITLCDSKGNDDGD